MNMKTTVPPAPSVLHVHKDLHPPNLTLIDIQNFKLNINQDICNVSSLGKYFQTLNFKISKKYVNLTR